PELHPIGEDLVEVLVAAHDPKLDVLAFEPLRDARDDVVGLVSRDLPDGDTHAREDLDDAIDLRREVLGADGAMGLVFGKYRAPVRRLVAEIERHGEVVWLLLIEDREEHLRED